MRFALCVVVALVVGAPGTAAADPEPAPGPNYQIPTPNGPVFPGVQTYQPVCLTAPFAVGSGTTQTPGHGSRDRRSACARRCGSTRRLGDDTVRKNART